MHVAPAAKPVTVASMGLPSVKLPEAGTGVPLVQPSGLQLRNSESVGKLHFQLKPVAAVGRSIVDNP